MSRRDAANWTRFSDATFLAACDHKPKLLDFLVHNGGVPATAGNTLVRACTTFRGRAVFDAQFEEFERIQNDKSLEGVRFTPNLFLKEAQGKVITGQFVTAIKEVQAALLFDEHEEVDATTITVHYGDTVVGVHVGAFIHKPGIAILAMRQILEYIRASEAPTFSTVGMQVCGPDRPADYTLGIMADNTPGEAFAKAKNALASWQNATCIEESGNSVPFEETALWYRSATKTAHIIHSTDSTDDELFGNLTSVSSPLNHRRHLHHTSHRTHGKSHEARRAQCSTLQVVPGDTCDTLAAKCGISSSDFDKSNINSDLCSAPLDPGQRVCCSSGTLPKVSLMSAADGECATYLVQSGDWCWTIATSNGLTVNDLEELNQNTWGWSGCDNLFAGINMCISPGSPPMPAPIENAVCGPQKPGTAKPSAGKN